MMSVRYKAVVALSLIVFFFFLDQATKYWAVQQLLGQEPIVFLNGLLTLVYAENAGAFLGLGGQWSREVRFVVFAVAVLAGLGFMLWYLIKKENSKLNFYAYSFILAGGLGNLWDRIFHENGHVVDFLLLSLGGALRTGVFNVADMVIMCGVGLALWGLILNRPQET
jgi:signal peptidase II